MRLERINVPVGQFGDSDDVISEPSGQTLCPITRHVSDAVSFDAFSLAHKSDDDSGRPSGRNIRNHIPGRCDGDTFRNNDHPNHSVKPPVLT